MVAADSSPPTLWHISISHFSEKVRWALDYKGIRHERRAPIPGLHMPIALWLTRGHQYTFPVLELDGRRIGDSTAIIATLEDRYPDPPLYPEDRQRALALEDWFDEQLGPYIRRFVFHELIGDDEQFARVLAKAAPAAAGSMGPRAYACAQAMLGLRYDARSDAAAELARSKVVAALDRLEAELGSREYLVGERFSVADLTAAALFYPVVLPPEAFVALDGVPERLERLRAELRERPGYRWVEEMFRRHRRPVHRDPVA